MTSKEREDVFTVPSVKFVALSKYATLRMDRITDVRIIANSPDQSTVVAWTGPTRDDRNNLFVGSEEDAIAFLEAFNKRLGAV